MAVIQNLDSNRLVREKLNRTGLVANNFSADRAPVATDDASPVDVTLADGSAMTVTGYEVGSVWQHGAVRYVCTDATIGAAVWVVSEGAPGRDGVDGADGADGLPGADGRDGVDGVDGADGAPGAQGIQGPEGPQGPQGPAGPLPEVVYVAAEDWPPDPWPPVDGRIYIPLPDGSVPPAATAPEAPVLALASKTADSITVSWPAPSDGGSAITGYRLYVGGALSIASATSPQAIVGLEAETEYSITVSALNAVGEGLQSAPLLASTEATPSDDLAEATLSTTLTVSGVTYTFDQPVLVGTFATSPGDGFVVAAGGASLVSTSHPSTDLASNGYVGNGMMVNPIVTATGALSGQGFDAYLGLPRNASAVAYDASRNVEPAVAGPLSLVAGMSLVHAIRRAGVEASPEFNPPSAGPWWTFDRYVRLHVLDAVPFADAYPPSASGTDKIMRRRSDVQTDVVRSLAMPEGFPEYATLATYTPDDLGYYMVENGEKRRRFRTDEGGVINSNYSAHLSPYYARYIMALHDDSLTNAQWWEVADRVIRHGTQIAGVYERGYVNEGGAGQAGALAPWIYAASFLLGDADYLAAARADAGNMTNTGWWATLDNQPFVAQSKNGVTLQPVRPGMIGQPFVRPDEYGTNIDAAYVDIATGIAAWENLAVAPFVNGPGGVDGPAAILNGPFNSTNQRAANFAQMTVCRHMLPDRFTANQRTAAWDALHDVIYPALSVTPPQFSPQQLPQTDDNVTYFTAVSGGVSWDISAYDYSTGGAITRVDLRMSQNQGTGANPVYIQWIEESDVGEDGTKTGLQVGVSHLFGLRRANAIGTGAWTSNHPILWSEIGTAWREERTPLGAASAVAPSFAVDPAIHILLDPRWDYEEWTPAPAQLASYNVRLACGAGYVTGDADRTVTYEWRADGVPILGATSYDLTTDASIVGAITCQITVTTPSGSVSHETAPVLTRDYVPSFGPPADYYGTDAGDITLDINPADAGSVTTGAGDRVTAIVNLANPGTHNIGNPNDKDVQIDAGALLYSLTGGTNLKFATDVQTADTHWLIAFRSVTPGVNNDSYRLLSRDNNPYVLSITEHSSTALRKATLIRTGATAINITDIPAAAWAGVWHVLEMRTDALNTALYLDGVLIGQDQTPVGWGVTYLGGNNQTIVPVERIGRVIVVKTDGGHGADDPEEAVLAARETLFNQFGID